MDQPSQEAPKRNPWKTGCLTTAGILVALMVLGSFTPTPKSNDQTAATSTESALPAIAVDSVALAKDYAANEVAAHAKYGAAPVAVSGTVTGITLDFADNPVVQMRSTNQFLPVQAAFEKDDAPMIAKISKGQKVTITCETITESVGAPMLSDCRL